MVDDPMAIFSQFSADSWTFDHFADNERSTLVLSHSRFSGQFPFRFEDPGARSLRQREGGLVFMRLTEKCYF